MSDEVDTLIQAVSNESGKSVGEIKSRMDARKKKTHGLLSDYGAAYAVAKEVGVDLNPNGLELAKIRDFKAATPVNFYGRVKMVYSPKEFTRKDGSKSSFASIVLIDDGGETRLVLWGDNTELTKKTRVGDVVLVKNGFVKENNGVFEVHAGSLTSIVLNPAGVDQQLPKVEEHVSKIAGLAAGEPSVGVVCRVTSYYPPSEFARKDGGTGWRASFIGEDESGKIRVVLWDNAAKASIREGDTVKLENGYTRESIDGGVELQVGNRGRVLPSETKLNLPPLSGRRREIPLSEIKPDQSGFSMEARVLKVYPPRDYEGGSFASMIVSDGSTTTRVVLWDEKSKEVEAIARDDAVVIENAYSRSNMSDEVEVHVGKYGSIKKLGESKISRASELEGVILSELKVADLEPSSGRVKISGTIVGLDVDRPLLYASCPSCSKGVQDLGGTWFCEACGDVDPDINMVVSFAVEDDTGNVRAVAFRDAAEKIVGLNVRAAAELISKSSDDYAPLKKAEGKLVGVRMSLVGKVRYNDYSDQLEFLVDEAQM